MTFELKMNQVAHLSEWHSFDAQDHSTYPKVNAAMQVKYADGGIALGYTFDFFPSLMRPPESLVTGWRYIKAF
jgi:hypothetical protein